MTTTASPIGRPRDPAKDAAVLAAARELLVEAGFAGTTVVAVARRARVGAPTIYRRWATREALIEDAAFGHPQPAAMPEPTGDLHNDLLGWTRAFLGWLADPVTRAALPGLLAAYHRDDELYERLVLRSEQDVRALLTGVLARALPGLAPPELQRRSTAVFDFLVASTAVRAMTRGLTDAESYCATTTRSLTVLAVGAWD
ncbi:TetR/AcrR family transcriptional regulator C-terminal ligand-binding domain-containing protein [Aldersonia sp. NBC_00410]|uniref:TetR-like C-terminal domain-containing protein n=1 Tax=Aldersonia sp. NBC_00410 TaxID=2975954 RepID=UPI002250A076|nr:TetR-like C-terminal domain-containing protein [Aldersonia sp. NBC_00410]MCX5043095.1 TetR/AcrR family transcriptional regulator C-terminal ligand-binding domain-containing protein [Aldersonia sp. NBC_00410]